MNDKDIPRIRKEIEERLAVYTKNDLNEALADQKAKIRDFVNIKIINEKDCMKKDKYQEQILEHHSAIEAYELILKFIERV